MLVPETIPIVQSLRIHQIVIDNVKIGEREEEGDTDRYVRVVQEFSLRFPDGNNNYGPDNEQCEPEVWVEEKVHLDTPLSVVLCCVLGSRIEVRSDLNQLGGLYVRGSISQTVSISTDTGFHSANRRTKALPHRSDRKLSSRS
jgi:hypothetical protein